MRAVGEGGRGGSEEGSRNSPCEAKCFVTMMMPRVALLAAAKFRTSYYSPPRRRRPLDAHDCGGERDVWRGSSGVSRRASACAGVTACHYPPREADAERHRKEADIATGGCCLQPCRNHMFAFLRGSTASPGVFFEGLLGRGRDCVERATNYGKEGAEGAGGEGGSPFAHHHFATVNTPHHPRTRFTWHRRRATNVPDSCYPTDAARDRDSAVRDPSPTTATAAPCRPPRFRVPVQRSPLQLDAPAGATDSPTFGIGPFRSVLRAPSSESRERVPPSVRI